MPREEDFVYYEEAEGDPSEEPASIDRKADGPEVRNWGKLPAADWDECVGKSFPPRGFSWPEGFCLGCKALKVTPEGDPCPVCGGTGRISSAREARGPSREYMELCQKMKVEGGLRPRSYSKWIDGIPMGHMGEFSSLSEGGLHRKPKKYQRASWSASKECRDNGTSFISIFWVVKDSESGEKQKGQVITRIDYLAQQRDIAIRAAEKICREIDSWKPHRYPRFIELYTKEKERKVL